MPFHLDLKTGISPDKIKHQQQILLMGSCFTEHIEKKLSDLKFNTASNPFGIVFNPRSIHMALNRILEKRLFTEQDVMEQDGVWLSLETHTSLNSSSKTDLLNSLNTTILQWHEYLKTADWLIMTFGSAFYYQYNGTGNTVANCHKLPAKAFTKKVADLPELTKDYTILIEKLRQLNPSLKVVFTVSPVKHLRDGVIENNLSKAILLLATHKLITKNSEASYFPAYELVNDDLRDYRFYEADMAHPNQQAINYVWEKFSATYFDKETATLADKLRELHLSVNHKPLHTDTKAFHDFKSAQLKKCFTLKEQYPFLNLEKEILHFS